VYDQAPENLARVEDDEDSANTRLFSSDGDGVTPREVFNEIPLAEQTTVDTV
jgi:hypothetical protein